jgi:thimet oligopeptidase
MKQILAVGALALFVSFAVAAEPPRRLVPQLDAAAIAGRCDPQLARLRTIVGDMERKRAAGDILGEFNRLTLAAGDFIRPISLMSSLSPDKATRDAAKDCLQKFSAFSTELYQSRPLFLRVEALRTRNSVDRQYREDLLEAFEDSGASLTADKQARVKQINQELTKLALAFRKAVDEDPTRVIVTPDEAKGLPESWLKARPRDDAGNLVVDLEYPTVLPFLSNAESEPARQRVWMAFENRGGVPNLERLDRAVELRHELARLYGFADYPTFVLRRRMAGKPETVNQFLDRVRSTVFEQETRELAELRADKAARLGKPVGEVTLQQWDAGFHAERIRRARYDVDQEALRAYFRTDASVRFAMRIAERLYGIEFVEADVPRWHADVRYYDVFDRAADGRRGRFVGGVYFDLYPRDGKYSHAAAAPTYPASTLAQRQPASVMMANFNRQGLNTNELRTLLHEFGHVLHGVLSTAKYAGQAGTSVKRDFVEAPSQMFEEWGRRPETLAILAEVCPQCPRLTNEQIQRIEDARRFGRGVRYSVQWQYATFDMRLYQGAPKKSLDTWIALERTMPLGYVEGSLKPANFNHVMSGYAAGYYGYLWSEVLAFDMLSEFNGKMLDPSVGRRYRQMILARGGEQPPQELVAAFLGRAPSPDAFFADLIATR